MCDFQEMYRYLVDNFVIENCWRLQKKEFILKNEDFSTNRKGKRECVNDPLTQDLIRSLNRYFQIKIEIPRVRMGTEQEIETLINGEVSLFAQYLWNERQTLVPKSANLNDASRSCCV